MTRSSGEIILLGEELPPLETDEDKPVSARRAEPRERHKTRDRFDCLNAFIDESLAGLDRSAMAVWLILFRDTWDGRARTSQPDLARRAGCNVRTVRRAIGSLIEKGLVAVVMQGGLPKKVSVYRVSSPRR